MANVSVSGIGSGLDITALVDKLVTAERAPVENRLNTKEANVQAKLSAYGSLQSALSSFQTTVAGLADGSSFQGLKGTSSDSSVVSVSTTSSAITGNFNVAVTTLATAQSVASKAFTSTSSAVGTGSLTFQFGTYDSGGNTFTANGNKAIQVVDIASTDNSLIGIRDAVNNAGIGVSASIVNDGSGYRLVFQSNDSGAANSLKVTVADTTDASNVDDAGLSQLAYDPTAAGVGTGKNMTETVAAVDASFSVNGLAITSSSNQITDAIEGVTLNLKDVTSGTPVNISVQRDTSTITSNVQSFISSYNDMIGTIKSLTSYDASTGSAGILLGDSIARNVASQVRNLISSSVSGLTGNYTSLVNLGITTQADGTLTLDQTKLSSALSSDYSVVGKLFSAIGTTSDSLISYTGSTSTSTIGEYAVNISQLATQATITGAATSGFPLTIDANNDNFVLKVDGTQSASIALTQQSYASGAELAVELQSRINGDTNLNNAGVSVSVSYVTDHFEISSSTYGSASTIELVTADTNTAATLGLSVGAGTSGLDVAGTIGGVSATGSGQTLTGNGDAAGISLKVEGTTTGSRGSVVFSRGVADQINTLLDGYLASNSVIDARTEGLNNRINDINDQRDRLARRIAIIQQRYTAQFTAMDTLLGQLQSTSNYLSQQLAALPGATSTTSK
jgi:flagellar hook-associated protein 2